MTFLAEGRLEQTFTGPGVTSSDTIKIDKSFNLSIQGTFVGNVILERKPMGSGAAFGFAIVRQFGDVFEGVDSQAGDPFEYRVRTDAAFSGTASVRLSRAIIDGGGGNIFDRGQVGGSAQGGALTDSNNSFAQAVTAGQVLTGSAWIDLLKWDMVTVGTYSDNGSAVDGLEIQYSADKVTVHDNDKYTIAAGNGQSQKFGPGWRYGRVKYTHGASAGNVVLQTILRPRSIKSSTHRLKDTLSGEQDADLVVSVNKGLGSYAGAAGTGTATVSVPSGCWVRSYAAQSGLSNGSIGIPGVSGSLVLPGSTQKSTQFSDSPDPGTLVGPCDFTFTTVDSYIVTWQSF